MITNIKKTVEPLVELVSLKEVTDFLKVDNTAENDLLVSLIYTATDAAEKYLNRSLLTQTFEMTMTGYPYSDRFKLLYGSVQSITSITATLSDDSTLILPSTRYFLASPDVNPMVVLKYAQIWDYSVLQPTDGVKIIYVAGYGDTPDLVPEGIKQAVLMMIANIYENREEETLEIPAMAKALLSQHRIAHF